MMIGEKVKKNIAYLIILFVLCLSGCEKDKLKYEYTIYDDYVRIDRLVWPYGVYGDQYIEIPSKINKIPVKIVGKGAFIDNGENAFNKKIKKIIIPKGVIRIESNAFKDCRELYSVEIPDSIIYIGEGAFKYCFDLRVISIPKNLEYIGDEAFSNTSLALDIELPKTLTYLGVRAFEGCDFKEIRIPSNLNPLRREVFKYCNNLTSISFY
jgi:hypothetical protein